MDNSALSTPVGTGLPFRKILVIALPVMGGSLIETLYNLTDAFFLGKIGAAQLSAPSISLNIIFFLILFGMGLSGAGSTLIAQSKGMGDPARMKFYLGQMMLILMIAAVFLTCLGVFAAEPILKLMATPPEVFSYALDYMRIVLLGIPFMFSHFVLQAAFTAVGDSFTPLKVHLFAVGINVALDPILIFGIGPIPAMGVTGAAIATIASQAVAAFIGLGVLVKGKHGLKLEIRSMRPKRAAITLFLKIGLPSSIGDGLSALGFTVLQGAVNGFGTSAIAAFGIGNRIMGLFDMPVKGLSNATASLAGQAMGARDHKAVKGIVRAGLILCVLMLTPPLLASTFFGGQLVRFFVDDPAAILLGDTMFKVVAPSILLFGLYVVTTGAFRGSGDTRIIMVLSTVRLWGIRVPLAFALARLTDLGPLSIWIAMFVSNLLVAIVGIVYFRSGRWKRALDGAAI